MFFNFLHNITQCFLNCKWGNVKKWRTMERTVLSRFPHQAKKPLQPIICNQNFLSYHLPIYFLRQRNMLFPVELFSAQENGQILFYFYSTYIRYIQISDFQSLFNNPNEIQTGSKNTFMLFTVSKIKNLFPFLNENSIEGFNIQ